MIKYPFPLNVCPMCNAACRVNTTVPTGWWECENKEMNVSLLNDDGSVNMVIPHYYVVQYSNKKFQQSMIVYPYILDTPEAGDTYISMWQNGRSKQIAIVPQIKPDISEKLLQRIKNLVILS